MGVQAASSATFHRTKILDTQCVAGFLRVSERELRISSGRSASGTLDVAAAVRAGLGAGSSTATGISMLAEDLTADGVTDLVLGEFQYQDRGRVLVGAGPLEFATPDLLATGAVEPRRRSP